MSTWDEARKRIDAHQAVRRADQMPITEEKLVVDVACVVAQMMRDNKLGLYSAMRIMGYSLVALAEGVYLEGEAERDG